MSENESTPPSEDSAETPSESPPAAEPEAPAAAPAEKEAPTAAPAAEPTPRDWRAIAILAGYAILVILVIWQTVALSMARNRAAEDLAKAETAKVAAVDEARKTGGEHAATALASGLHQLFLLRSQYPEITERTFQAVCAELAATQNFDLAVITDSQRRVIASSNLNLVGQAYEQPVTGPPSTAKQDGMWVVTAPVKSQDAVLGGVVLRLR